MAEIKDILNNFPEELLQSSFKAKIFSGNVDWKNNPILLKLEQIEANQILFSIKGKPLRLSIANPNNTIFSNGLFWITDFNNNVAELKYLPSGSIQFFNDTLDIGFGDNILFKKKDNIDNISSNFYNDYVFKSDIGDIIFVETYPSKTDVSFTIHGLNGRMNIVVKDNKWFILNEVENKPFTKKYEDFVFLNIVVHPEVKFVEESKANVAIGTIKAEEKKGNTLIYLWEEYSKIEEERAQLLKETIGELNYNIDTPLYSGVVRIKLTNLSDDLKTALRDHKEDIEKTLLEECKNNSNNNDEISRFRVKSVNSDFTIDLYDELELLSKKGTLVISILGDEVVKKRRDRALSELREKRTFLLGNLWCAIEGHCDLMLPNKRKEKPLTDRTKQFLRETFGIEDLTKNQKEAVEIAINTPDIAVIQGPPGTGKTTVAAAICDRLLEIGKKSNREESSKQILVSAFQNDTVEHIASKIRTFDLPTIKIGKVTQSNIRPEDKFSKDIKTQIDISLQKIPNERDAYLISKKLKDIKKLYEKECNEQKTIADIELLLKNVSTSISDNLFDAWQEIRGNIKFNNNSLEKNLNLLRGLRTDVESYNDDGDRQIGFLLKSDILFNNEEKEILENAPFNNPNESFLEKLIQLQEKHLETLNAAANTIASGKNLAIDDWLDMAIQEFKNKEASDYTDEATFLSAILEELSEDLEAGPEYLRSTIKEYAESIAATNQIAGGMEMSDYSKVCNVILEEAARSNPLDLLIPMTKAKERIILIGDQNQLPHLLEDDIVEEAAKKLVREHSSIETRKKLEESLFGIIFRNLYNVHPTRVITLKEQFRMHPFIGDFISRIYYNGELTAGNENQADLKKHNLRLEWGKDKVAVFCDVKKVQGIEEGGKSKSRKAEARRIIQLLDELKDDPNFENLSIGIISFYAKQVNEILCEASKKGYAEQIAGGGYQIAQSFKETRDHREQLRIGSVDSFQGKEFDVVILSTVRSNRIGRIGENYKKIFGFLTLENRLNVAFSRAQKLLIVVGDSEMFSDDFAEKYIKGLHEFYNNLSINKDYGNRIQ